MFDITRTSPAEQAAALASCNETLNRFDAVASTYEQVECPVKHTFTPGMYGREIFMPKGTLISSKIHKTEHQYVVVSGEVSVWIEGIGIERIKAPYFGVTKPGTRRALFIHEDCVWKTFHPTVETDLEKVEAELIFEHDHKNPALSAEILSALADTKL